LQLVARFDRIAVRRSWLVARSSMSRSHQLGLVLLLTAFAISVLIRLS
jgi:hypothetical protein